ncbi:hypothetical protein EGT67_21650 [Prescottella agglutinans]|uniref:Uncharacterized protein n=1 Tax=Prescottella agglutinans TaxID=1644129 RepID=A0A438B9C8_9NOCA|nr:hypothetical protein [Prescottella agglutinans]RVW07569.1 hypothetical protein EGT67_21650 [Prescottella agglutinans]
MIANTRVSGGLSLSGKVLGAVLLALFLAAVAVIAGPAVARADAPAPTVEYSSDGGVTWGGVEKIQWRQGELVPGQSLKTTFRVRSASGAEGTVGFAVGDYELTPGMIATARVDIDGKAGNPVTLTEARAVAPGTSVGSVHLAAGGVATVDLVVGMPAGAGNQAQSGFVNPRWAVGFTPGTLPQPGCVATGSLGSLSCMFGGTGSLAS